MAVPTEIRLDRAARILRVTFEDGAHFDLPAEYLRVESPSAEVQGHGPGQKTISAGKQNIAHWRGRAGRALRRPAGVRRRPRQRHLLLGLPP